MKKILTLTLLFLFFTSLFANNPPRNGAKPAPSPSSPPWIAYYGEKMHVSNFYHYDPLIFVPQHHPLLAPLLVKGKTLLAYISLGDCKSSDYYHKEALKQKLFIGPSPHDSRHSIIDIRNPKWEELLLQTILPEAIAEGFNGFCFGNLDLALNLELQQPETYQGMTEAALSLLATIKKHYGNYKIMIDLHGLLHIGEQLIPNVDLLLYESLFTKKDSKQTLASVQNYLLCVRMLKELQAKKPSLLIYTLDFWPSKDPNTIKMIYAEQRRNGFLPYVTEDLLQFSPEPG